MIKIHSKTALLFNRTVLNWFDDHGRKNLPWQQNRTPYRVWVSEIMLQQTQVATVIPYYERFMAAFPDVKSLAHASQDDVLHLWTGLGYYARGRNLHACAQKVVNDFDGHFPNNLDELQSLPGIGKSTAGAILSLSMDTRAAILDGNVKRVLARIYGIEGWPGTPSVQRDMWQIAESLTPHERYADYTQAMMDLGATLCKRSRPQCGICPFAPKCAAYQSGEPTQYPHSKPKKDKPTKQTVVAFVTLQDGSVLLTQRPQTGIWGGLWSLPQFDNITATQRWLKHCRLDQQAITEGTAFRHTFSHYHLNILPLYVICSDLNEDDIISTFVKPSEIEPYKPEVNDIAETSAEYTSDQSWHWYNPTSPDKNIGLPAPIKKLIVSYHSKGTLI